MEQVSKQGMMYDIELTDEQLDSVSAGSDKPKPKTKTKIRIKLGPFILEW